MKRPCLAAQEIAVGTGLNLPLYSPSQVQSLTALDLSSGMLGQVGQAASSCGESKKGPINQNNQRARWQELD